MPGSLDATHELEPNEQFCSLWDGFDPQPPVAANLGSAMNRLLDQALASEFPGAPDFEAEIKTSNLKKVYAVVSEATQSPDGRVAVEKTIRPLIRHIANPLMLGEMGHDATHFVIGQYWRNHFNKKATENATSMSVGQLRKWINQPRAMGLSKEVQNLVILVFAEQTNRTFSFHNVPVEGSLGSLPDDLVLLEQKLPSQLEWDTALARAGQIFGEALSPLLKASTVASLSNAVKNKSADARAACLAFCERLKDGMSKLGIDPSSADRVKTASATHALVNRLNASDVSQVVTSLVTAAIATTEPAMGECLSKAAQLTGIIDGTNWEIFDAIGKLADGRQAQAGCNSFVCPAGDWKPMNMSLRLARH